MAIFILDGKIPELKDELTIQELDTEGSSTRPEIVQELRDEQLIQELGGSGTRPEIVQEEKNVEQEAKDAKRDAR